MYSSCRFIIIVKHREIINNKYVEFILLNIVVSLQSTHNYE